LTQRIIALDAMGGDHAPEQIVLGALEALPALRSRLVLVGDEARIRPLLPATLPQTLSVKHASQTVEMEEKPTDAFRTKKDSSLYIAAEMVKEGQAHALISAGNTGAATTFSLLLWKKLPGVRRPAIVSRMPNRDGGFVLLDCGASPDVEPEDLLQFSAMGRAYAEVVMGRKSPRVHLLNIGEEEGKGNAFSQQAFRLLKEQSWFAGNIEGKDMYNQPCDVVVCDAFVGNVVLKASEGVAELIRSIISEAVPTNPFLRPLYWPVKKVITPLRKEMDYASAGGAPLLGLNGLCIICHGRSSARAIRNALASTDDMLENDLFGAIRSALETSAAGSLELEGSAQEKEAT
jgi:glycerol-3-phosphate acyltransferase PlsX